MINVIYFPTFEEAIDCIKPSRKRSNPLMNQKVLNDVVEALLDNIESDRQYFNQRYENAEPWERLGLIGEIL